MDCVFLLVKFDFDFLVSSHNISISDKADSANSYLFRGRVFLGWFSYE